MGYAQKVVTMSEEEYLAIERKALAKSEFYDGHPCAMAGGTLSHNLIAGNVFRLLANHLSQKPCRPFIGDVRLKAAAHRSYFYPDVLVVCDKKAYIAPDMVNDATVIVEVLSPSTASFDLSDKFHFYQSLPSLQEYVLIHQEKMLVTVHRRQDGRSWLTHLLVQPENLLELPSLEFKGTLAEVYQNVELPPLDETPQTS